MFVPLHRIPPASRQARLFALCLGVCALTACDDSTADEGEDAGQTDGSVDVADVEAALADLDGSLVKASSQPFPSDGHSLADTVDVWISSEFADEYAKVDPSTEGSAPQVPVGAVVVKEQFDADGILDSYTVMVKLPNDAEPSALDWWWGFANSSAEITIEGNISNCVECHAGRPDDGWLFGVPK